MALYIIGLGLGDEKDITLNGMEAVKKCDLIYLEGYTSILNCSKGDLEKFYNKKIIIAGREMVENDDNEILKNAAQKNVALLVVGDAMSATTHIDLYMRAGKMNIERKVIHNASIISAIGITGLQVYKFGRTASIPLENENIESPYTVLKENLSLGLHTLFLLDLDPINDKFLTIKEALDYLLAIDNKKKNNNTNNNINNETKCIGCARIGSKNQLIEYGKIKELINFDFGKPPYCLIVPGKLHFMEEEALKNFS